MRYRYERMDEEASRIMRTFIADNDEMAAGTIRKLKKDPSSGITSVYVLRRIDQEEKTALIPTD
jgi:hypothetical protein